MKEFITAVEDVLEEEEREEKIKALIEAGKTRDQAEQELEPYVEVEMSRMVAERDADGNVVRDEDGKIVATKVVDRVLHAYTPHEGQLTFLMAALGRGQTQDQRFASIVNLMLECLRDDDRDYLESRLLTSDRSRRIPLKQMEEIFEYLVGEWFGGKVIPKSSDSATSPPSDGQN